MRHMIPISGKDSMATAIVQRELDTSQPYEYIFNDTGAELPEVNEWLAKVETFLGQPIQRFGDDLTAVIKEQGILPSQQKRYCTRLVKIGPMEYALGTDAATVYYGIRADENRPGYVPSAGSNIHPVYPLKALGLGIEEVWKLLEQRDLLPPAFFWQELYEIVLTMLPDPAWLSLLKPWQMRSLFSWRSRTNCYYCFNQRIYEWVGLFYHHPDLFQQAIDIENSVGAAGYYWMKDRPLPTIAARARAVTLRRAKDIVKLLARMAQMGLFEEEEFDVFNVTSCGLLCGK